MTRRSGHVRVGVIGGGQLARMMVPPAVELGVDIAVLGESVEAAARIAVTEVGDHRDLETVLAFARGVDVVTFDHEHVPQPVLRALVDAGIAVRPGPDALQHAQDKLVLRRRLQELGIAQPEWAEVADAAELADFLDRVGGRAVVKTPRGGYDGHGVRVVSAAHEADDWLADGPLLAEELVDFRRELAQLVARRPSGEVAVWPLVETVQGDGVCREVFAPAPRATALTERVSREIAHRIADALGVTGVLAVELFEAADDRVLVNELAMRPHNSGHWTIDGAVTSQFEQHLRAVLDLPLGSTEPIAPWSAMINVLGGPADGDFDARVPLLMADQPAAKLHLYGKTARPGRKVGHVTATGEDLDDAVYRARAAVAFLLD
ncbi:5-(carboxyamino)imidazole ribonucleotide synthase [Amnibacterium setariae]|uniref:N5-carboxyaminoimidazole ribonucleotide synthase n=1 Tax=Amnibacterium setariae TaxID=2306585 RepID=A0A3A1TUH4_9MICO|nr:5-(carboxyamino)imidazole ribonucleotide synthase [Amnibacterium setariae]RIX26574.1 5-(carboxyamino)imidazole ribonucleotide synthase [Amnibacterium setariae]